MIFRATHLIYDPKVSLNLTGSLSDMIIESPLWLMRNIVRENSYEEREDFRLFMPLPRRTQQLCIGMVHCMIVCLFILCKIEILAASKIESWILVCNLSLCLKYI